MLLAQSALFAANLALATTLLWSLHPLLTDSVTYVIQRTESFMGCLFLLTLYCVIRSAEGSSERHWRIGAIAACALGMASKEVMVVAPLVIWLYDALFLSRA